MHLGKETEQVRAHKILIPVISVYALSYQVKRGSFLTMGLS